MNLAIRDESEDAIKEEWNVEQEGEGEVLNQEEERFFRALSKIGKRPKMEITTFSGSLKPE